MPGSPHTVDRLPIIALDVVGSAQVVARQSLLDHLPAGRRNRQSALGGGDGLVMLAQVAETVRQEERDLSHPTWVVEGRREGLRLAQVR